ncbi:MAG: 2-C-methyl-D-erythritol 4-phosphate cytidylyltransferase [Acidimicrobiales bacterium]|nr:2-C-methyl-D-erythritol 4-phosphate cytidylyltransferase [Acidimicrobiales bacterium]
MPTWTIVCAGGAGHRFGADTAKQYVELGGKRLIDHAVTNAAEASDFVVVGAPAADVDDLRWAFASTKIKVIPGGVLRSDTVRCALAVIPSDAEVIVVHDAARPLAPSSLFEAVVKAVVDGADAAIPGLPVADTVKRVDGDVVVETLDRSSLVLVQTPQAFRGDVLRAAHVGDPDATDDAALVERGGGKVVVVPGSPAAAKVTTPDDLLVMQRWLS